MTREDSDDLAQLTLMGLVTAANGQVAIENVEAYVRGIFNNQLARYFDATSRTRRDVEFEGDIHGRPELSNAYDVIEETERLRWCLRQVSDPTNPFRVKIHNSDLQILGLWLDGYPYQAISEQVGVPSTTVGDRVRRLRIRLPKAIAIQLSRLDGSRENGR